VPQFLWKLRGFDVVHLHAPFIGAELVLKRHFIFNVMPNLFRHLWISKQVRDDNKQRLIVTYHHDLIANDWRKYIFGAWNKVVLPLVARVAEKIIGSSLDYIERSNLGAYCKSRKGKFVEIPFGVDINKFRPLLRQGFERHAQRLGFSAEEKIVLFVGGLDMAHNFKGVEHLISAAKILKDRSTRFRVLVIGDGDLRPDLERQVANFGLRHVVKFFGNAEDVLPDLYNLACVEVLPSTTMGEAFGLVLLEAMACGKPIIASNLPGVRTVCEDGVNGLLVKPGDAADLAKKLALILSDDELAARLGEAGLQRVKEKYNWKKVAEEHLKVYGS
jgi:glycosyltransferase involved in cell wall biosynthesis